jgi:hypothetical protein
MGWRVVGLVLLMLCVSWAPATTAAPVYGGHATVLKVIYPEL